MKNKINLRRKAEELLKEKQSGPGLQLSETDALRIVHELEIHQIELELQNKELKQAKEQLGLVAEKYVELYDFAPSGYFTLAPNGSIIEINLSGANFLGKERSRLKSSSFGLFVTADTRQTFDQFLAKVFSGNVKETCDVTLSTKDKLPFYVQLTGIIVQNGKQCLITAVDISKRKLAEQALAIANKELIFQNEEKAKRAAELAIANKELAFQKEEKIKRANELSIANSYLENLFSYANAPIIVWDPQFRITRFNHAFEVLTGRIEAEVLGQSLEILFPQPLVASSMELIRKTRTGERWEAIEIDILHREGHVRTVLWNSATLFSSDSVTPISTIAQGQDITERKRAEAAHREALDNLQKIASRVPGVVYQFRLRPDGSSCYPYASEAINGIYRVSPDEVREDASKVFADLHPDDIDSFVASIWASANDLSPWKQEYRVKFDDGTVRTHYGNAVPQKEDDGSVLWHGFITDITESKQDEAEKRKADTNLRILSLAIEQSPVSTILTDMAGNIGFVNPVFTKTTGYTSEEAIGQNPRFLKGEQKSASEYKELWDTILSGQSWHGTFHNKKKNGELFWESAVISPVKDGQGNITHFLAVKEDVTERKEAEQVLLETNRSLELANVRANEMAALAEAANKSKSTFLANMSHEIRTPLNAIIGFSQLMDREKSLTATQKDYIVSINRAGEYLLSLINDILELSKAEAGRVVPNPTNFDLHALLNDLAIIFKERAQSKQLSLIFETETVLPRYVFADEGKLRRIFINLIGNAIKFTDHGSVIVRVRMDEADKEKSFLVVEVIDTGPGIADIEQGKLFKNFEQTNIGVSKGSGTGLGLALSRELAILMGGNISATSKFGKGSVFVFKVEVKTGSIERTVAKTVKRVIGIEKGQKANRILVVDDKEDNLKVAVDFLRLAGFETMEAMNGKEAIAQFEEYSPDLILMDMRMPVMDGYEATRRIKSTEKGMLTPVVALTASVYEEENEKMEMLGLQGYIRKPFTESVLYGTIAKVLGTQYLYEDETTLSPTEYLYDDMSVASDIAKLPDNILMKMRGATATADFELMVRLIKSIKLDKPLLAKHMMASAKNFDWYYLQYLVNLAGDRNTISTPKEESDEQG